MLNTDKQLAELVAEGKKLLEQQKNERDALKKRLSGVKKQIREEQRKLNERRAALLGACRELAPSKQESTTYEPSLVCKLLILCCRLLIPERLLGHCMMQKFNFDPESKNAILLDLYGFLSKPEDRELFGLPPK